MPPRKRPLTPASAPRLRTNGRSCSRAQRSARTPRRRRRMRPAPAAPIARSARPIGTAIRGLPPARRRAPRAGLATVLAGGGHRELLGGEHVVGLGDPARVVGQRDRLVAQRRVGRGTANASAASTSCAGSCASARRAGRLRRLTSGGHDLQIRSVAVGSARQPSARSPDHARRSKSDRLRSDRSPRGILHLS